MGLSSGRWTGRIPPFTVTLNRVFIHWIGLADQTSMFREAKEVDSQTSHAAQYASTLLRPTRAEALESAKKAVIAKHEEVGFNPKEIFARLGIDADLANYIQLEAQAGGKMSNAGLEETIQRFFEAFNRGDLDAVIALYELKATMVAQPGQMAEGCAAIREALIGFLAMKPTLATEKKSLVTAGGISVAS